jgi:DNA-binding MarR family transcriptional regulator
MDGVAAGDTFDVVLVATPDARPEAEEVITYAGGRLVHAVDWSYATDLGAAVIDRPVLMLAAEGIDEDRLLAALPAIRDVAERDDLNVVATFALNQIDIVAGALIGLRVQLLCDVSFAEWVGELAVAGRMTLESGLADRWREDDGARLRRVNAEIARIAELLTRLATRDRDINDDGDEVGDRRQSFSIEPIAVEIDPQAIRQTIRARRMRETFLGKNLFEDPAWDMLLDLFDAELEGVQVSVSSLCIAAGVAPTTALRWIAKMTEMELFIRHPDPADRRRAFMTLSPRASEAMQAYMIALRKIEAAG